MLVVLFASLVAAVLFPLQPLDPTDGNAPQCPWLRLLLQCLSSMQPRLLWHSYLHEHPLNPRQIEMVMGLSARKQKRMEEEALALLRQTSMEYGAL